MDPRSTEESVADLERIANYLFENRSGAAEKLLRRIYRTTLALRTFPHRGRSRCSEMAMNAAPPLHHHHIAPSPIHASDAFAHTHRAKSAAAVELNTRNVLRKNTGLKSPDACLLGRRNQCPKQSGADPFAA